MIASAVLHRRAEAMRDADAGRLPEAEMKLDALVKELEAAGERRGVLVATLSDRATVRRYANRWDDALADLDTAEGVARSLPALPRIGSLPPILQLRAKILATRAELIGARDAASADALRREAQRLSAELRTFRIVAWAADELDSDLAFRSGEWDKAAELGLHAARALRAEGWDLAEARLRRRAGAALLESQDLVGAEEHLRFAFDFFQKRGPVTDLSAARLALARLAHARGQDEHAWDLAGEALTEIEGQIRLFRVPSEQQLFVLDKARYYLAAFEIGLAKGDREGVLRAWSVAERAKSFYLCQLVANADIQLFDGVDPADVARLHELEAAFDACEMALGRLGFAPSPERDQLERRRASLSAERQDLLARMMKANPRWGALRVPPALDLGAELAALDPAWVPLSFYWSAGGAADRLLHIFHAPVRGAALHSVVTWSAPELGALDAACRQLRGAPTVDPLGPVVPPELTNKLLPRSIRDTIGAGQRLLISPHLDLRALPLHALQLDGDELVVDRWPVQYIPTLALLPLRRDDAVPERVLALGCVSDSFGGRLLRDVIDEIGGIEATWSATQPGRVRKAMLPQDGTSLAAVGLPIGGWHEFGVVHLACHGDFPEGRPFDAALLLGDTQIGPTDIFGARLRCSTVSLSACSLGRSVDGDRQLESAVDEWSGLHIPLLYAGARTLIVSLWDADSRTAAVFMTALHRALSEGSPPVIAANKAVTAVRSLPAVAWANWYLSGLPN